MGRFKDKVVLITGASAGLGEALAREFASQGAKLVLLARRMERLKALANEIDPTGDRVLALRCDITLEHDLEQAVQSAREQFSTIDVAIANAGISVKGSLETLSLGDYQHQWETNIFGVLRTIYATLDDLKQTEGRLVIISSIKSYIALPGDSPYSMSKYALRALCEALRNELSPYGVSVTHVCPGYIDTEIRQVDNQGILHPDRENRISPLLLRSPQETAYKIVKAVNKRQPEQILTAYGKLIVFLNCHVPGLVSWVISTFTIKIDRRSPKDRLS